MMRLSQAIWEIFSGIVKWFGYLLLGIPEKEPPELSQHPRVQSILFAITVYPLALFWVAIVIGGPIFLFILLVSVPFAKGDLLTRFKLVFHNTGAHDWVLKFAILGILVLFEQYIRQFFSALFFGKHQCEYCFQRYNTEEKATQCCLSVPPTKTWLRRHIFATKWTIAKHALLWVSILGFSGVIGHVIWGNTIFDWWTLLALVVLSGAFIKEIYRPYMRQKSCTVCGVVADFWGKNPLCSRCYAQQVAEQERQDEESW